MPRSPGHPCSTTGRTKSHERQSHAKWRKNTVQYDAVDKQPDFPALERRIIERWRARDVVRASMREKPGAPLLSCYDGPPTANGRPGVHHVEARVFKDVMPRYFTMKGYHVPRRAGWDCHGIPVELEVEKQLGFTGKPQIEQYGVAEFNARCRESVTRYVEDWKKLTERIAYWCDMEDAYWTMSPAYVESVWWSIKNMYDRGLLYEDFRVVPYCPRCGTTLSDHEVAQGYAQTEDLSIYFVLPLLTGPLAPGGSGVGGDPAGASLLAWTTLPWTVVFSTLAVIGNDIRYVLARGGRAGNRLVVLAADLVEAVLGAEAVVVREVDNGELLGARYRAPFEYVGPGSPDDPDGDPASTRFVVAGDFVTTGQGTGIVSTAPAYGEDDMRVAKENHLPVVNYVDTAGCFDQRVGPYAGMYVRDVNVQVVQDMEASDYLLFSELYSHTFPFCWRCSTPLLYYAKPSWYIATTRYRDRLLEENATVDWRPEHIRSGRYGDWLTNNVDWALSRERYWGTPMPLWRCQACRHTKAVGSLAELGELTGGDMSAMDPHRPFVDDVTIACAACGDGEMRRVPEVIDAWYDSGAMPFAQFGYPHKPGSSESFERFFPSDYTAEAIDQTRGWWYSLHAISTILFDRNSYRRALCLGHIVDVNGRKMSKSLGNVLDPWSLIDSHGADGLRWLMLVEGNPWQPRRIGDESVRQVTRKLLLTIWNTYYFFVTHAELAGWNPRTARPVTGPVPVMDRYGLAEVADVVTEVDRAFAEFDITRAGRRVATFVDDLSNWYLRRNRDRFWDASATELSDDANSAFSTLYTCLRTLAGMLAPLTPFLADEMYENLVRRFDPEAPDSVHLSRFPQARTGTTDPDLRKAMTLTRRVVALGRDARVGVGVPVRCPLQRAVVTVPADERDWLEPMRDIIAAELNLKQVTLATSESAEMVKYTTKPNFRVLGPLFGARTPAVVAAIQQADADTVVAALRAHGQFEVCVNDETVTIAAEAVQVIEEPVTGWQISTEGGYSIAIDRAITTELRLEWLARDLVRMLNELRKRRDLHITDRVRLSLRIEDDPHKEIDSALRAHEAALRRDVLAVQIDRTETPPETGERIRLGDGTVVVDLEVVR
nr:isoleucine--tRNA ligase [Micromonospora tarapacensis]